MKTTADTVRFERPAGPGLPEPSVVVEHDLDLGGAIFMGDSPLLHVDGSAEIVGNTAVGLEALVSVAPGIGYGYANTAVGVLALNGTTLGARNTALGAGALRYNLGGDANTAIGSRALYNTTTGSGNVAVGASALFAADGKENSAVGYRALAFTTDGSYNTAFGHSALLYAASVEHNTTLGWQAMRDNVSGSFNTAVGSRALRLNAVGSHNVAIGYLAGFSSETGSSNIWISHEGETSDANTLRIGAGTGTGERDLNRAFIAGVRGIETGQNNAVTVVVDGEGQLGTISSSRHRKRDIRPIGRRSSALMDLRPVSFRYRSDPDPDGAIRYGLIAEEVAEVLPELVVRDADGGAETVQYHLLAPLLLNELQQQRREIERLERELGELRASVASVGRR